MANETMIEPGDEAGFDELPPDPVFEPGIRRAPRRDAR